MFDINENAKEILGSIDGFLMIDDKACLVFMCEKLMQLIGVESFDQIRGKKIYDVIPTNKTHKILETGTRQIGVTYLVQGHTIISNSYPIYRDKKLIGALEYDVFEDADLLFAFLEKMSSKEGLEHYGTAVTKSNRVKYTMESIKGSSSMIKTIKNEILQSSRSSSTVLITGETGTGKELIAQAIHMAGHRSIFGFIPVNCSSIPADLFESELFGYQEGSFTGAKRGGKKGLIRLADKGTLFLDEVDTLPMPMQAKLLRFLQEREVWSVGAETPIPVDVRVICACNHNLAELVESGDFRQDLYYRLNVINITAVALRDRRSDIPELINSFIDELNVEMSRTLSATKIQSIEKDALALLMDYDWPGNIRELKNVIERAMNRCKGTVLQWEDFPDFPEWTQASPPLDAGLLYSSLTLKELRKRTEMAAIQNLVEREHLSVSKAAERLGITRQMLHKKIRDYGMKADEMTTGAKETNES